MGNDMKYTLCSLPIAHMCSQDELTDARELSNERQDRAQKAESAYHVTLG